MPDLRQKVKLVEGMLTGDVAMTGPFYVSVGLARRCSLLCVGCSCHSLCASEISRPVSGLADLPLDLFIPLGSGSRQIDTQELVLQGPGDRLLHRDICQIVSTEKEAGFRVVILTNGTLLNQNTVERLVDARPDTLKASLWATSAELHKQNSPGVILRVFKQLFQPEAYLAVQGGAGKELSQSPHLSHYQP